MTTKIQVIQPRDLGVGIKKNDATKKFDVDLPSLVANFEEVELSSDQLERLSGSSIGYLDLATTTENQRDFLKFKQLFRIPSSDLYFFGFEKVSEEIEASTPPFKSNFSIEFFKSKDFIEFYFEEYDPETDSISPRYLIEHLDQFPENGVKFKLYDSTNPENFRIFKLTKYRDFLDGWDPEDWRNISLFDVFAVIDITDDPNNNHLYYDSTIVNLYEISETSPQLNPETNRYESAENNGLLYFELRQTKNVVLDLNVLNKKYDFVQPLSTFAQIEILND